MDSETSLRLADNLLAELHQVSAEGSTTAGSGEDEREADRPRIPLPDVLLQAYTELVGMLDSLRHSRSIIEQAALERLHRTHQKLREVSSATELAATDMLDGLDRALGIVDELDRGDSESGNSSQLHAALRDEIHRVISCLQFQDITSQQISYASSVLEDLELRLSAIAELIDRNVPGAATDRKVATAERSSSDPPPTFDPAASTLEPEQRQAVADAVFLSTGTRS